MHRTDKPILLHAARHLTLSDNSLLAPKDSSRPSSTRDLTSSVIFGERHLRFLINEFVEHYMTERFHQGIGGQLIRNVGPTNDNATQ